MYQVRSNLKRKPSRSFLCAPQPLRPSASVCCRKELPQTWQYLPCRWREMHLLQTRTRNNEESLFLHELNCVQVPVTKSFHRALLSLGISDLLFLSAFCLCLLQTSGLRGEGAHVAIKREHISTPVTACGCFTKEKNLLKYKCQTPWGFDLHISGRAHCWRSSDRDD